MPVAQKASDFAFELTFEAPPVGETRQMVSESGFFAYIKVRLKFEQCASAREQKIEVSRVSDIAQRPNFRRPAQIFGAPASRGLHDDRNEFRKRISPYPLGQLVTVQPGHHDIRDDQIRLVRLDGREC